MKITIVALLVLVAIVAFFLALPTPGVPQPGAWPAQEGNSFVLRGVRVFDGERILAGRDVRVEHGMITAVGPRVPVPDGVPEFAADGYTLMPALLDAHTHNFLDSRRDALRFGVGTQIDMFSDHRRLAEARSQREFIARTELADMWSAGTLVTVAGGHGIQYGVAIPTLGDPAEAEGFIAARIDEGSDFIKLVLEHGEVIGQALPTLSDEALTRAIAAAQAHGRLAVVHALTQRDARLAVGAGADGLVHVFADEVIDVDLVERMRERGVFVIPTLAVLESISGRASGLTEDARIAPWLSPEQRESLQRPFPGTDAARVERALANTRALHEAGVSVLAGSDAPNPGTAHGASLHRELQLLVEAGMSPAQALRSATRLPAERFGIPERGQVEGGYRADLVLVAGNPAEDIEATRAIEAVWKNGYRVERTRLDAPAATTALADGVLGTFTDGTDGWVPTADAIQGGGSAVEFVGGDGMLVVDAEVRAGAPWPWAGVMRMLGEAPMAPVDISAYQALEIRLRADGPVFVMFFSGVSERGMPQSRLVEPDGGWQELLIPLAEVRGLDAGRARAIAVVAGQQPGERRIEIESVVLR